MTVASQTSKVSYAGNGSTTAFTVPFYFLADSHLKVTYRDNATGTETVKILATDYTVSGAGNLSGGTVTMNSAPASGISVVISRNVPLTQEVDYQPNDPFPAATHEMALDKLTMETQQIQEQVTRSIKISTTNTMASTEFSVGAADRANKVLGFDSAGELTVASELGTYRGNWASGVAYAQRDLVKDSSNANIYICLTAHTSSGAVPISTNTDAAKWALIVDAATANTASASAAASAALANDWATKTSGPVAGGDTSAKYNAQQAASSASSASSSAASATSSASLASSNAASASSSASSASASAASAASSASSASASAAAASAAAASGLYRQVIDKSANYTIVAADQGTLFRGNTGSGAITFTLPLISSVSDGFKVWIVKWTGDANPVNIVRSGSDTINGATSAQIGSQYSQIIFVADFETNTWFASQSGLGATNMNVDVFTGNGSTTVYTLTADPGSKNNTDIYLNGVHQDHSTYSISGTTLTFSTAPPSAASIEVNYGTPLPVGTPSDGTIGTAKLIDGSVTTPKIADANVTPVKLSTGAPTWDTSGNLSDAKGEVRLVPQNAQTGAYTLVAADHGKHISITTGGVTVPSGVFSAGQSITIYNNSASNQTITQGASVTMYQVGTANTGNRTLAQRGLCTVFCVASNTFVITGGGLS